MEVASLASANRILVTSIPFLNLNTSPLNTLKHTQEAMAPRKKTEEKASANEASDMVLHYLRKSLTSLATS